MPQPQLPHPFAPATLVSLLALTSLPAQDEAAITLRAGDRAPAFAVECFLQGEPIAALLPGHVYVLEFWATWCGPCIAAMPHLAELQAQYRDKKVDVLGINVWEDKEYSPASLGKAKAFVAKRGAALGYTMAFDGAAKVMDRGWMQAAGRTSIPCTFVVDGTGKIAWIGHPTYLDLVLDEVVRGTWDLVDGPKKIEAGRAAIRAACEQYRVSLAAGDAAWQAAIKAHPHFERDNIERRYQGMLAAGHCEAGYALGRSMFERAKAKRDFLGLMDVVTPMMDPQAPPKVVDRKLALDVAAAAFDCGDPTEPTRHISLAQIHFFLGNLPEGRQHKAKALELVPADHKDRAGLERWLQQLEDAAGKK